MLFYVSDISSCREVLIEVQRLCDQSKDVLHSRIESVLEEMSQVPLCELSELRPITTDRFLQLTEETCQSAVQLLTK